MTKTRDLADLGGGFIQAGTGAVQRTVESKLQDVVSVKDFGAVGDGTTDDTSAITNALGALAVGQVLYFPPGTYKIISDITITKPVGIRGDSPDATCLQFNDCNGIKWNLSSYTGNYTTVVIDGLCFETTVDGTRTGLQYENKQFFGPKAGRIYMTNCWLRGIDPTKQWLLAMDLNWAYKSYFEAVWIYGKESNSADAYPIQTKGVRVNNCTGCVFEHCDVYRVYTGWTLTGQSEGNNWNNGVAVAVFYGIVFSGTEQPSNHQTISNYHVAAEQTCIDIGENTNASDTRSHYVTNVFLLQRTSQGSQANNASGDGMINWKGIKCDNVQNSFFVNIFGLSNFNPSLDLVDSNSSLISFEADCSNNTVSAIYADRITRAINSGAAVNNNSVTGTTILNGAVTCLDVFRKANVITEINNSGILDITGRAVNLNSSNGTLVKLPDKGASVANNAYLNIDSTTGITDEELKLTGIANDGGACDISINPSGGGRVNVGGSTVTLSDVNSNLQLGSLTTANTPFIDFHSSGNNIDYDARIIATAGDATIGNGKLSVYGIAFRPGVDNDTSLGEVTNRWTQLFAATATINTSDEREKQDIEALSDAELRVATALKGLVKKFRFKDAVQTKGGDARIHIGVMAQEVIAAFQAEGLDPMRYGIVCYDQWDTELDGEGNEITSAGDRYGIRYEELLAFIIAAL